jgi:hypothetical protein
MTVCDLAASILKQTVHLTSPPSVQNSEMKFSVATAALLASASHFTLATAQDASFDAIPLKEFGKHTCMP